jgi:hypothetical protein
MEDVPCLTQSSTGVVISVSTSRVKVRYVEGHAAEFDVNTFTTVPKIGDRFKVEARMYILPAIDEAPTPKAGRKFARISPSALKALIVSEMKSHEDYEQNEDAEKKAKDEGKERDPLDDAYCILQDLTPKVAKDLGKVQFSTENMEWTEQDDLPLCGFHEQANGLTFLGISAGGDWESPVFFIIYWDGTELRAYIPTDGNPWNKTTKKAYGNSEKADMADKIKVYQDENFGDEYDSTVEPDWDAITKDIHGRIVEG